MVISKIFTLLFLAVTLFAQSPISIVPKPIKCDILKGKFTISEKTKIWIEPGKEMENLGDLLTKTINEYSGLKLSATWKMTKDIPKSLILLETKKDFSGTESYKISMKPNLIKITALNGTGIFYGLQSLFQLFPLKPVKNSLSIPCLQIEDSPRFKWRGVHLDACRHFFPVEFVKKYIDMLSMYKMNTFHWHLTEDQGWRIEIKKYPKLTEIGAWRKEADGKVYGGFYSQEQIREVVDYAKKKYITIIPEIEMPGHALAALTAYPELSCKGGPFEVTNTWGVFDDVYCAGNEKTFEFIQDILSEVFSLFPSEVIHIGGDECPKTRWKECPKCQARIKAEKLKDENELQSYFIQRIEKFVNSKGKRIIGWDEILEGGLAPNASVMSWRGIEGGIAAAKAKHFVVMSPVGYCYFDYAQGLNNEPKSFGGYNTLEKVYSYEPIPDSLTAEQSKYILGAQANLWTEHIETTEHAEYMLMPRMLALSEVVWSPKNSRSLNDFLIRMQRQYELLEKRNINFRIPPPLPDDSELILSSGEELSMIKPIPNSQIRYTLDGSEPTLSSPKYVKPISITSSLLIKAKTFLPSGKASLTPSLQVSIIDTTLNGLKYKYYEGVWDKLPSFDSLTPKKSGKIYRLNLREIKPAAESYGIVIEGNINITESGKYTFYLSSDDGSKLFIGDNLIIDNDGAHGNNVVKGDIDLSAGKHPLRILYFNKWGSQSLKLEYEGEGLSRRKLPANLFFLNN